MKVTVHFFKPSGKWYGTEEVEWTGPTKDCVLHDAFEQSLKDHAGLSYKQFDAICLEQPHEHSHPIQLKARHTL